VIRRLEIPLVIFDSWWCSQNFDTILLLPENKLIGVKKKTGTLVDLGVYCRLFSRSCECCSQTDWPVPSCAKLV